MFIQDGPGGGYPLSSIRIGISRPGIKRFFQLFPQEMSFSRHPTGTIFSWFTRMIPGQGGMPA
jgi:hypothetical protein